MLQLSKLFRSKKIVPEVLIALIGRIPDKLEVEIHTSKDGGYFAEIRNLPGCITQAESGQELFEMVNDAVYTYFDVPTEYFPYMPVFLPPERIREKMEIRIPNEFLDKNLAFQRI